VLWTGAYFVASCGGVTIEQLKVYVQSQDCPDSSHR
ncbi:MAG: IS200/IS605 family transposase, partial [Coleofasciculus sp. G2-EDA-02]